MDAHQLLDRLGSHRSLIRRLTFHGGTADREPQVARIDLAREPMVDDMTSMTSAVPFSGIPTDPAMELDELLVTLQRWAYARRHGLRFDLTKLAEPVAAVHRRMFPVEQGRT